MKAAIVQPKYSLNSECSAELFRAEISLLDACDESLDMIVMPEYSDIPALPDSNEMYWKSVENYHDLLLEKAAQTARRCSAFVFVNGIGERKNTTYAFDRKGELFGKYYKHHLTEGEVKGRGLSQDYALYPSEPYVIEAEGIRFAFLTCYDFYFYEAFSGIARQNVDIIIGCSHQRSDPHDISELFSRFAAYNCNAYLLRASVSMNQDSDIGGGSMVVSPRGEVLLHMKSRVGIETVEFDPKEKYYKPAGFGNLPSSHWEYVEKGRRPWNYRPAGSAITLPDALMPYPRLCVTADGAPDSGGILPFFGGAIALDANEICYEVAAFDTDETVEVFSEIMRKFSCHAVMNILIGEENMGLIPELVSIVVRYDCEKYVYFSSESDKVLNFLAEYEPQIKTCYCVDVLDVCSVSVAFELRCKKIQFCESVYSEEGVMLAHSKGLRCNMLFCGDSIQANTYINAGIDTLITKDISLLSLFRAKNINYVD